MRRPCDVVGGLRGLEFGKLWWWLFVGDASCPYTLRRITDDAFKPLQAICHLVCVYLSNIKYHNS